PRRSFTYDRSSRQKTYTDKSGRVWTLNYAPGLTTPQVASTELPAKSPQTGQNQKIEFNYNGPALAQIVDSTNAQIDEWGFGPDRRATFALVRVGRDEIARGWLDHSDVIWHAAARDLSGFVQSKDLKATVKPDDKGGLELIEPSRSSVFYGFAERRLKTITRGSLTWTYEYESGRFKSLTLPNDFLVKAEYSQAYPDKLRSWSVYQPPGAGGVRPV